MEIAHLLIDRKTHEQIAERFGLCKKTIARCANKPEMLAYMEQVRAENHAALGAKTKSALGKIAATFTFADSVRRLLEIADQSENDFCKLKAIAMLNEMFRLTAPPGDTPVGEAPAKPDVYRANWMQ
jgi:phosphoserine phosphatase